ncbi:MAG: hypothetical protein SYNGOMJ08_00711 [Candidatus Syntrophoarchaeum sp. GoM_oil]|nr:MAG: hypothetical protein SYNGOMJ08_00711 [Candidatus Syntrophoarchaeum sp. GoM_oil]
MVDGKVIIRGLIAIAILIILVVGVLYVNDIMPDPDEYLEPEVEGGWESPSLTSAFIILIIIIVILLVIYLTINHLGIL